MSNKSAECYTAAFNFIEKSIFKLEPANIMTDWELGMRSAIRKCYPKATLRGCWFHYCSAIRKKLLKLGLHFDLKISADARMIKKMIMSLPLLPSEKFAEGYEYILQLAKECQLLNTFKHFFSYFQSYWVAQVFLV